MLGMNTVKIISLLSNEVFIPFGHIVFDTQACRDNGFINILS